MIIRRPNCELPPVLVFPGRSKPQCEEAVGDYDHKQTKRNEVSVGNKGVSSDRPQNEKW